MELSKQEMELFLLFPDLRLKNFFYEMFLNFISEFKPGFENRKWIYPNRKWNFFFYFLTSDQKTSFTNVSKFYQQVESWFRIQEMELSKQEMELYILFPGFRSKNFFLKKVSNFY